MRKLHFPSRFPSVRQMIVESKMNLLESRGGDVAVCGRGSRQLAEGANANFDTIEGVPQWATVYFMYGDDSGLSKRDKELADEWLRDMKRAGYTLVSPIEGSETDFNSHPEFGLACSTEDWTVEVGEPEAGYSTDKTDDDFADPAFTIYEWINDYFSDDFCEKHFLDRGYAHDLREYLIAYMEKKGYPSESSTSKVPENLLDNVEQNGINMWRDSLDSEW